VPGDGSPVYSATVPAVPEGLQDIHRLVARAREDCPGVAGDDFDLMETAIIELAGNIVRHEGPMGAGQVTLTLWVHDDALEASLVGAGPVLEIDIESTELPDVMDEAGRGLAMARLALDHLSYRHDHGLNRWHLRRER
jgi:serine/threonine-protein kinase RsbW